MFDHNRLNFQIFLLLVPEKSSLKLAEVLRIDYRNKRANLVLSFEYPVFIYKLKSPNIISLYKVFSSRCPFE